MARDNSRSRIKTRMQPRRLSRFDWLMRQAYRGLKFLMIGLVVACAAAWIWAGGFVIQAGVWAQDQFANATASVGFAVVDVMIKGRHYTDANDLKRAINVDAGDPIFGIDLDAIHTRIENISWVRAVRLRRALPDRLIITLEERLPFALWMDAPGEPALIDENGVVLTRSDIEKYGQLLAIEGRGAPREAAPLIELLKAQPSVAVRVKKAVRISERRWDLILEGGTAIRLPEDDPGFALARLAKAQEEEKVLDQGLKGIDLRMHDRIILEGRSDGDGPDKLRDLLLKNSEDKV